MIKFQKKKTDKKTEQEKVDERREEVLAKGRKFKYPLQFAKHKLVRNAIIIAFVAAGILTFVGWGMLYKMQSTDDVIYRMTRVLPVAVADVDGEKVMFSDYLMFYRSSIQSVQQQSGALDDSQDAENLKKQYKRAALDEVEKLTFAIKIAKEKGIKVGKDEIDEAFVLHRNVGGAERSEESFLKVIAENFGLSRSEYERMLKLSLIREKVQIAIDESANRVADKIEKKLSENGNDFEKIRDEFGSEIIYEETGGLVDAKNIDGGRANRAISLQKGENSGKFVSSNGDGYYFVKLLDKTDTEVNYQSIKVVFSEFEKEFLELKNSEKINEYIEVGE